MNDFILEILQATEIGTADNYMKQVNYTKKVKNKKILDQLISCPKCRTVWQWNHNNRNYSREEGPQYYYVDFPHYGKPKEICPKCKKVTAINNDTDTNLEQ